MIYLGNSEAEARIRIIATLFGAYGQAVDGQRPSIYVKMLKDIPVNVLERACQKIILENKFLPSIAEIVEASRSLVGTADDDSRIREWNEAWSEIERAMQATPWGEYPTFSRPEIAQAVASFGWHDLQMTLAEDMPTVRAQVRRMYEDVCKRTKERGSNEYILGKSKTGLLQPAAKIEPRALRRTDNGGGLESVGALMGTMAAPTSAATITFDEWHKRHGKEKER
jgi:hypothetical protein|nr:MAG TPA: replisome organizer protein [Caudoviricetes sp.]